MELTPGTAIDRYVVESHLGSGGMADVYRVRHATLGHLSALKVLQSTHPGIRDRLILEGRVQANLRHPNVVAVSDVIDVYGSPGLIMEYISGSSLDRLLERHRLGFDEADALARGILLGLIAAHAAGTVHRDLKPANILLGDHLGEPTPKITDFGLAKALAIDQTGGASATKTGTAMGTPAYMAPEQIRNAAGVDHRADLFSMGAILFELVTGTRAFPGEDLISLYTRIGEGRYADPRAMAPHVPDRMVAAIHAALCPDPADRVATAAALLAIWAGTEISRPPAWRADTLAAISNGEPQEVRIPSGPVAAADTFAEAASPGPDLAASLAVESSLSPPTRPAPAAPTHPPTRRGAWPWIGAVVATLGLVGLGVVVIFSSLAGILIATTASRTEYTEGIEATEPEPPPPPVPDEAPVVATPEEPAAPASPAWPRTPPISLPARGGLPTPPEATPDALSAPPLEPVAAPEPPAPEPAPVPASAEIRVRHVLDKNVRSIERREDHSVLVDTSGARFPPGKLPPGTYTVKSSFAGKPEIRSGTVYVSTGDVVNVTCFSRQARCEAE